jgi:uncharacterized membrane protein YdfJ with MMPL/SSD domain
MIGAWVVLVVLVFGSVAKFGAETSNDLTLPGTGSQSVKDLLEDRFPPQQNGTNPIVFDIKKGKLTDKANKSAINASIKAMKKAPHVYSVTNPLSSSGQTAGLLSKDKQTAFAPVLLDVGSGDLDMETAQAVFDTTKPAQDAGISVAASSSIGSELSEQPTESSELVGILAAMFILTLVLGSLVAMGMPIISAVAGLGIALATVGLMGHLVAMPDTGATLATMIGLGVGIDYALFLVTRHQEHLEAGMPVEDSIARAVATSGSAIVFAGGTVVVALVSLRVAGIPLLSTLGLASAVAVVTAVLAAITFLPAVLGLLGTKVNAVRIPAFLRKKKPGGGVWGSWAGFVAGRPVLVAVASLLFLAPLIVPAPSLQFGQEDIGAAPKSTTERQAYDWIAAGFGVGYNGPLQVASKLDPVATPSDEYTKKYNKATSLQKQLEQAQKQLPKQQKQLEAQQKQLEAEQKQLEAQQADLEAQRNELEIEQADLEAQQQQLLAQQQQLENRAAVLTTQGDQLQAQKTQLEREQAQLEREQALLETHRDALREQREALAAKARPLLRQLGRIRAHEVILQRRIDNAPDGSPLQQRLQQRLDALEQTEQQVENELAPLLAQARRLIERGVRLAESAEQLNAEAQQLQNQAAALQRRADNLNARKAALTRQGNELQQEGADLKAQGNDLKRQGAALQKQATALQNQGDQLQQQGNQLQKQANHLKAEQNQAEQQQKQAEKLQKQLTAMVTTAGGDPRGTDPRVVRLQDALSGTKGVVDLTPPQINKHGDVVMLSAVPSTGPATDETTALLSEVRDSVIPGVEAKGGITSYVGGYTASYADLAELISERLLLVIGTVILLGFLLLMIAFRSVLIPLQAAITNVLSAAAAFGILTATFQWGWGISLVGLDTNSSSVPIASYVPLMMFAVLFGLSMDYEVFLVSHIQQHHLGGEPARQAAASGLRTSGRITTAACLIMTSVFASFILNGDPTIKQFGVGLATAVLLAGILVITLAPATISLMGEAAWWLPRWLDRILPHIDIEGENAVKTEEAPEHEATIPPHPVSHDESPASGGRPPEHRGGG